ncbi:proteasome accessory factor PafA2 [Candidatus Poribacteria bacterium]|nr:proteasome accessory factor PafA2 [Candidatus Poribacteria bacterium]
MNRLFGIETEYGIILEGEAETDPLIESIAVVRSYRPEDPTPRWDYALEDPFRDARGFRATELLEHPDEREEHQRDRKHELTYEQVKSDRILHNGARLYNDHAHPEYSTPECLSLFDLVAHDKAGERILLQAAQRMSAERGSRVILYKNNTDFQGHSYGCHDNYIMSRDTPFDRIKANLTAFNVTRQVFAGAGKIGIESESGMQSPGTFQLSQRSDFFEVEASVDTMHRRPLVNTRDEPHADRAKYRRLHGIVGDANMCEYATALKIGTTALVLDCIEQDVVPESLALARPLDAIKAISHDPTMQWRVTLADGTVSTAIAVQREYLRLCQDHALSHDGETEWVLREWESMLDALERDPMSLVGQLDWVTKKWLLTTFVEEEGIEWSDPWLRGIDLEYHSIDVETGLYYELQKDDGIRRLVSEERILDAVTTPPSDTRAYVRGQSLARFGSQAESAQWDSLKFRVGGRTRELSLNALVEPDALARCREALDGSEQIEDFLRAAGIR